MNKPKDGVNRGNLGFLHSSIAASRSGSFGLQANLLDEFRVVERCFPGVRAERRRGPCHHQVRWHCLPRLHISQFPLRQA
jgi:hypothetical protein